MNQPYLVILGGEGKEEGDAGRGGRDGCGGGLEGSCETPCEGPWGPRPSPRLSVGLCTDPRPSRLMPRRAVCELGESSEHKQASV